MRGRGLFCQSLMKAQMASPAFTPVYAGGCGSFPPGTSHRDARLGDAWHEHGALSTGGGGEVRRRTRLCAAAPSGCPRSCVSPPRTSRLNSGLAPTNHGHAALVSVVNTKFPELGELLLHRLIAQVCVCGGGGVRRHCAGLTCSNDLTAWLWQPIRCALALARRADCLPLRCHALLRPSALFETAQACVQAQRQGGDDRGREVHRAPHQPGRAARGGHRARVGAGWVLVCVWGGG